MKKSFLLLIAVFSLTVGLSRGTSLLSIDSPSSVTPLSVGSPVLATLPSNATLTGHGSDFARGLNRAAGASFAQLNTPPRQMPSSSMWIFALLAVGVIGGRIFDLRRTKALADHEHETYQARDRMYHSLYKRD